MINYIAAEIYKFRKSKVKYSLGVLLIPSIIMFMMYAVNDKYDLVVWKEYLNLSMTFLNFVVAPVVFGITAAYILAREYETKTINVIFTYPIDRLKLLVSKLAAIMIIIFVSLLFVLAFSLISGLLIKHENLSIDIIFTYVISYLLMSLCHFMVVCITSAVAICLKSVLSAAIFVIGAAFVNLVVINTPIAAIYPWSAPVLLVPHDNVGRTFVPTTALIITLAVTFICALAISIKKYKYIE